MICREFFRLCHSRGWRKNHHLKNNFYLQLSSNMWTILRENNYQSLGVFFILNYALGHFSHYSHRQTLLLKHWSLGALAYPLIPNVLKRNYLCFGVPTGQFLFLLLAQDTSYSVGANSAIHGHARTVITTSAVRCSIFAGTHWRADS